MRTMVSRPDPMRFRNESHIAKYDSAAGLAELMPFSIAAHFAACRLAALTASDAMTRSWSSVVTVEPAASGAVARWWKILGVLPSACTRAHRLGTPDDRAPRRRCSSRQPSCVCGRVWLAGNNRSQTGRSRGHARTARLV